MFEVDRRGSGGLLLTEDDGLKGKGWSGELMMRK